jgi:uncharacterized membrane protein (UPF0182 family)
VARYEIPAATRPRVGPVFFIALLILLLLGARSIATYIIDYNWWREMSQVETWFALLAYSLAPVAIAAAIVFAVLFTAHTRGMKFGGERLGRHKWYARVSTAALLLLSVLIAAGAIETWTVVRYFGGRHLPAEATSWRDPVFAQPLKFYLFDLPFYEVLRQFLLVSAVAAAVVYWLTARGWQLRNGISDIGDRFRQGGEMGVDLRMLGLRGALESHFLRVVAAVFLLALAFQFFLGRYEMLWNDHGFMVGIDYVDEKFRLPLQWLLIATCVISAGFAAIGRWRWLLLVPAALLLKGIVPAVVAGVYVRPNEISIERPYIQRHIEATRNAFALDRHVKETEYHAKIQSSFDPSKNQAILGNVRLWDWRAFHDTVTQIQSLRPYYTFADTDVDRYMIDGQLRQLLLTPRELDIRQLPEAARSGWPNTHFVYTHGYGLVVAEANRITPDGLPFLFIQDAPPVVKTPSLKLTRPELYYSEVQHEPVFVHTAQPEFDYPSGADNKKTSYQGKGGFPVSSFGMRMAAAVSYADPNILLTGYLTPDSRMMIRRSVRDRLEALAGFLTWETDPYLVLTDTGRQVWTIDGYTTSESHPYSRRVGLGELGEVNYMRNAVKATVDAYDGETHIYVFDAADPIIRAYQHLFPKLFQPFSEMPAQLRAHARYPETLFRTQAEIYRTFHMLDAQAFYNREDLWDIARTMVAASGRPEPMSPTYVVASLPGEDRAEFLLIIPFTPRNKDNLIGLMVARCDGEHLGELVVLQLSKQELIFGPMQIEARINQDQTISKDLTLWNQQGSTVVRGQMLVLPIGDTFLYAEPLYIQAAEARMPQLKKVVLAMGNLLIYTDTYDQALAQLSAAMQAAAPATVAAAPATAQAPGAPAQPVPAKAADPRIEAIRSHLKRYRDLASQGRWAEAGKELEAIEAEVNRR